MRSVSISNRGGRENNEDCVRKEKVKELVCFALCDGLGGHAYGEIASKLVADGVCAAFKANPHLTETSMREYIENARNALEHERFLGREKADMSSTVVALVTDGLSAVWANAGDSRLYRLSGGKIKEVTRDHSIAYTEYESGLISYDGIRRSFNQNKLTQCVGTLSVFNPDIYSVTDLKKGDAFLMCSDGFWEFVAERDIEKAFSKAETPREWLSGMLDCLHKNKTKYNDNYSAIAIII